MYNITYNPMGTLIRTNCLISTNPNYRELIQKFQLLLQLILTLERLKILDGVGSYWNSYWKFYKNISHRYFDLKQFNYFIQRFSSFFLLNLFYNVISCLKQNIVIRQRSKWHLTDVLVLLCVINPLSTVSVSGCMYIFIFLILNLHHKSHTFVILFYIIYRYIVIV